MTTHDSRDTGYGTQVFWGLYALRAVFIGVLVAVLPGFPAQSLHACADQGGGRADGHGR